VKAAPSLAAAWLWWAWLGPGHYAEGPPDPKKRPTLCPSRRRSPVTLNLRPALPASSRASWQREHTGSISRRQAAAPSGLPEHAVKAWSAVGLWPQRCRQGCRNRLPSLVVLGVEAAYPNLLLIGSQTGVGTAPLSLRCSAGDSSSPGFLDARHGVLLGRGQALRHSAQGPARFWLGPRASSHHVTKARRDR